MKDQSGNVSDPILNKCYEFPLCTFLNDNVEEKKNHILKIKPL